MNISETLRQIYMLTPVGSCEMAALTALTGLAHDQDFEAVRALVQIMTFELAGDAECARFQATCDPAELLSLGEMPPWRARDPDRIGDPDVIDGPGGSNRSCDRSVVGLRDSGRDGRGSCDGGGGVLSSRGVSFRI